MGEMIKQQDLSFEDYFKKLQDIVKKLEKEELSLEDSLHYFEEGLQLFYKCQEILDKIESRIEVLLRDEDKLIPYKVQ